MLEDMNRIIKFVLERYSVNVQWRIIPLTFDKWKKLSTDKTALDELAWKQRGQLIELMNDEKIKHFTNEYEKLKIAINNGLQMEKEIENYVPPPVKEKTRIKNNEFAVVVTRSPSYIDEYSLRPENHLMWLIERDKKWDDDRIEFVIGQIAKNYNFNEEAIDRIKKWDMPKGKISNFYWQKILEKLDDIPQIRERIQKEKEASIQSGGFKRSLGIDEKNSIIVTKGMLGKEKLEEIKKELSKLN